MKTNEGEWRAGGGGGLINLLERGLNRGFTVHTDA